MRRNLLNCSTVLCGLAVAVSTLGGCSSSLSDENALLMEENQELRQQLVDRAQSMEMTQAEIRDRENRIAELERSVQDARAEAQAAAQYQAAGYGQPQSSASMGMGQPSATGYDAYQGQTPYTGAANPFGGIEGVTATQGAGEVTASLASDVLFDPGRASLKKSAQQSLDALVRVLHGSYAGKTIRVAGHTDADPIRKSGYKSNYHLGFERAYAVREYLVKKGISSQRVYIASHGPDRALGSKKQSRRVDIAIVLNDS